MTRQSIGTAAFRLGVVSQCYDPESGSAAVTGAICRALAARGLEVHVLTGFPNYPIGKIFPGYRVSRYQYENLAGVHVHRVPLMPSHDRSGFRRALTYLSFAASASLSGSVLRKGDVWLVICSQITTAIPALVAKLLYRRPYVLHIHDLWPDTVVESGFVRPGRALNLVKRGLSWLCDTAYRHADAIAVTSPGMQEALRARGVPGEKLIFVPNWIDETIFHPVPGNVATESFTIMYAGSLGDLQGLETAIEAVRLLPDLPGLRLVLAGSGVAEARLRELAAGLDNVTFLGPQELQQIPALMAQSDVQLVALRDLPLFRHTLPSKLQAIFCCGRPVLGCVAGDAAELIEQSGAGLVSPPGDAQELASAVRQLHSYGRDKRETMGRNGREFYLDRLSAESGSAALAHLVIRALRRHRDR